MWEFVLCSSIFDPQSPVCLTSIVSVYDVWTQLIVLSPGPLDEVDSGHILSHHNEVCVGKTDGGVEMLLYVKDEGKTVKRKLLSVKERTGSTGMERERHL